MLLLLLMVAVDICSLEAMDGTDLPCSSCYCNNMVDIVLDVVVVVVAIEMEDSYRGC